MKTLLLRAGRDATTPASLIETAVRHLRNHEVVALPTETVYGLAGNALEANAVLKIFSAKERPSFDPLIVHLSDRYLAAQPDPIGALVRDGILAPEILNRAEAPRIRKLIGAFWPGPLTLLLPKGPAIPDLVTSGLPAVGIRMPAHPLFQAVLRQVDFPLAAPSANRFGRISPTTAEHVAKELDGRISAILDGGECPVGVESTILSIGNHGEARILRPGKISAAELQAVWGAPIERESGWVEKNQAALAPGLSEEHYAPRKPLHLVTQPLSSRADLERALQDAGFPASTALLTQKPIPFDAGPLRTRALSADGSCEETARNLFSSLRSLDEDPLVSHILADLPPLPRDGLAAAIADRLNRASRNKPLLTP